MRYEETVFTYNLNHLPDKVMSEEEYRHRRDMVINDLISNRLATRGALRSHRELSGFEARNASEHHKSMLDDFEHRAKNDFAGQFDDRCSACQHCKIDARMERSLARGSIVLTADCYCMAMNSRNAECFDGYVPATKEWHWRFPQIPVRVYFDGVKVDKNGNPMTRMIIQHDKQDMDMTMRPSLYVELHPEPQGIIVRDGIDHGYLTKDELKLGNAALARERKCNPQLAVVSQPQTPVEDAW